MLGLIASIILAPNGLNGLQVATDGGKVIWITRSSCDIPRKGFVILFTGNEEKAVSRFKMGSMVTLNIKCGDPSGHDWLYASEALGCGPLLVNNSTTDLDLEGEGFTEPKILGSASRSFVGITVS